MLRSHLSHTDLDVAQHPCTASHTCGGVNLGAVVVVESGDSPDSEIYWLKRWWFVSRFVCTLPFFLAGETIYLSYWNSFIELPNFNCLTNYVNLRYVLELIVLKRIAKGVVCDKSYTLLMGAIWRVINELMPIWCPLNLLQRGLKQMIHHLWNVKAARCKMCKSIQFLLPWWHDSSVLYREKAGVWDLICMDECRGPPASISIYCTCMFFFAFSQWLICLVFAGNCIAQCRVRGGHTAVYPKQVPCNSQRHLLRDDMTKYLKVRSSMYKQAPSIPPAAESNK
jgi:hypothetical protein